MLVIHIGVAREGQRGYGSPKNFRNIAILCFERRFFKQNCIIRLKSNILATPNSPPNFCLATPLVIHQGVPCTFYNKIAPLLEKTPGYLLHKRATLLPDQMRSKLPKFLKAKNAAAANLLMSWGSMATPVLKMQATSEDIQPSNPSSRAH